MSQLAIVWINWVFWILFGVGQVQQQFDAYSGSITSLTTIFIHTREAVFLFLIYFAFWAVKPFTVIHQEDTRKFQE